MPPPRKDAIHRYFIYDETNKSSICEICGNKLKGKHTTNLKNHLSHKHLEQYQEVITINKENVDPVGSLKENNNKLQKAKKYCLRLVSVHGRPLSLIDDQAFQDIINMAVPSNARTKNINKQSIKLMISEKAYEIKSKISFEIRNRLISLKLDSASYMDRSFIGINLQYVKNGKIIIRNLAVAEVYQRQTGEFIKQKLLEVLNDYYISQSQIYSITTDNGTNFKKMARLMRDSYDSHDDISQSNIVMSENDSDDDELETTDTDLPPLTFHPDFDYNQIFDFIDGTSSFKPRTMFCAAHTLQLAIKDAIDENVEVQATLGIARNVVKILRRPNIRNILRVANMNKAIIDCVTRWTSTYNMLNRLLSLKEICNNTVEIYTLLSEQFWVDVNSILECLRPVNEATLLLQREQLTIGDLYITWLSCQSKLEAIGSGFASSICKAMKRREANYLKSDVVLEALFLDLRLNVILSEEESGKAKRLLKQTQQQLEKLQPSESATVSRDNNTDSSDTINVDRDDDLACIEVILHRAESEQGRAHRTLSTFDSILNEVKSRPRLQLKENILEYWNSNLNASSILAKVANTVLAVPATQVSVERLFSSLKFILSPLRSNISQSLLQDIMVIRANKDLLDEVNM